MAKTAVPLPMPKRVLRKHTYCKGEFDLFIFPPDLQIVVMQVTQVTLNIFSNCNAITEVININALHSCY